MSRDGLAVCHGGAAGCCFTSSASSSFVAFCPLTIATSRVLPEVAQLGKIGAVEPPTIPMVDRSLWAVHGLSEQRKSQTPEVLT